MVNSNGLKYDASSMKHQFFLKFVESAAVIAIQYLTEYLVPALDVNIREQKFHLLLVIYLGVKVF